MSEQIRLVNLTDTYDAEKILGIYKPYILDSDVTFECQVPTLSDFTERIKKITAQFPWLVYEIDGEIAAYSYADHQREREAFQWNAEISVYVNDKFQKRGIAQKLYNILFEFLRIQGYKTAYACITYPNEKSLALHAKYDFKEAAIFRNTGFKLGKWKDVIWLEKQLNKFDENPTPPKSINDFDKNIIENIIKNPVL